LILKVSHLQSVSALFFLLLKVIILHVFFFDDETTHLAYGHFFGSIKQIGNYQIVFQPLPFVSFANEESTLNFSILDKNNANANNVYAALTIKDKATGQLVEQTPFGFYEFSDISFPYKFRRQLKFRSNF